MSMSQSETGEALLQSLQAALPGLSEVEMQQMFAALVRAFATRYQEGEIELPFGAQDVSATDVAIAASGMLAAVNMQVFELGLWQTFQGRP